MPLPCYAQIEPTTKCNFNCLACTRKSLSINRLNRDLSFEKFRLIIEQIPTLKRIKLQGLGEPFLCSELKEILEFGKEKDISFETFTNGSVLKDNLHLISYFDYIFISFDASLKEKFEVIRKGSNFDQIIENLKKCIDFKTKNKLRTKIGLNVVVSHLNYKEIPEIIKRAISLRLDFVLFVEVENWFIPAEDEYLTFREFIKQSRIYSLEIEKLIQKEKEKHLPIKIGFKSSKRRKQICGWPFYKTFITHDGFVTPCEIRMNPDVFNFGNVFEENFKKIWNGLKFQKFREKILKNEPNQICDFCPD
jgi:MoaA/NifB/PqqE/SkfB family radical SAM enzyme